MKCPACGKENPTGEQFCLDCGSDLSAAAPAQAPATAASPAAGATPLAMSDEEFQRLLNTPAASKPCPHCGAAIQAGGTFCDSCGEPLTAIPGGIGDGAAAASSAPAAGSAPPAAAADAAVPPPTDQTVDQQAAAAAAGAAPPSGPTVTFDLAGPTTTGSFMMKGDEAKVGRRDPDAGLFPEIDFDGNDIVVDGGERVHAVSRRHGRVFRDGGDLKFEDLGSTNGSTLDGAAVLANDPQPLKDGSVIVLGRTCRITVHIK